MPNPFQPAGRPTLPFSGELGQEAIAQANTLFPYPLLVGPTTAVNTSLGTSDYHSLQLRLGRRFAGGLSFDAHYTWSRTRDMSTHSNGGGATMDNYDIWRDYGPANWDVPHRFVASYIYDVPFLKDSSSPLIKYVAAGWQVSIHTVSTEAHEMVLDAFEAALGSAGPNPLHHRIDHAIQVNDEQLARMVAMDLAIVVHLDGAAADWVLEAIIEQLDA